jgi:hypothetical protein
MKKDVLPALAIANHNFLGEVPEELRDLTIVEEALVARCRAKCWIVQLKEDQHCGDDNDDELHVPGLQRGMKGHIMVFPQQPEKLLGLLPPPLSELNSHELLRGCGCLRC